MDPTTTGALRMVLNVTEVSAVAEMERMRANTERMMKAYHFQQTVCAYSRAVLTKVNALWGATATPMTRDEFHEINGIDEGYYNGPQYLVNILVSSDDDDNDVMAFVEPTLHPEESYLVANGPKYLNYASELPLADLETLAKFLGDHPDVYDAFMGEMSGRLGAFSSEFEQPHVDIDTPSSGIVCV